MQLSAIDYAAAELLQKPLLFMQLLQLIIHCSEEEKIIHCSEDTVFRCGWFEMLLHFCFEMTMYLMGHFLSDPGPETSLM